MGTSGIKFRTMTDGKNRIRIVDTPEKGFLSFNGAVFSKVNKESVYTGGFWDYFIPLAFAFDRPRVLVLGLGGGTMPYQIGALTRGRAAIDSVEISRKMAGIARKFVPRLFGRVIIGDGFDYVARTGKEYDLVVLDVYDGRAEIPRKFLSQEFVDNARRILSEDGILAVNYAKGPVNLLMLGIFKYRLRKRFGVYSVKTSMLGDMTVLVCLKGLGKEGLLKSIRKRFAVNDENRAVMKRYAKMKKA